MINTARLTTPADAIAFMTAGKATVTLVSNATGKRFTYRISKPKDGEDNHLLFVGVLSGPDNGADYSYLGTLRALEAGYVYAHGRKARVAEDAPSAVAFRWAWGQLAKGKLPDSVAIYHEGRCGRCNRLLTVPESIMNGIGPECASKMACL